MKKKRTYTEEQKLKQKESIELWKIANKKELKEKNKLYNEKNKEKISMYQKEYRELNKDKIREKRKEYFKEYRILNKDKIEKRRKLNSKRYNKVGRESTLTRRKKDPVLDLRYKISKLICISLKNGGYTKRSKTYQILGCSYEEFKTYIQSKFSENMSWENHGEWHLYHKIPASSAKDEDTLIRLNHYSNFQPLWAKDNIRKGNKLNCEI
jgi:hypothetical protein